MALLDKDLEEKILKSIKEAELNTSGEIRLHVDKTCEGDPVLVAQDWFYQLGMDKTDLQNGVLFYLALESRKFSVIGDKGIDARVPDDFWKKIIDDMIPLLKENKLVDAMALGIKRTGEALSEYFPYQKDDINELSDEISYGEE